ncbi:MAG: hypothetical protein IKS07_07165 [Lachnospiraceae bacterium]|nr:hypothetical protein [Lachnospiraceae bacterium]
MVWNLLSLIWIGCSAGLWGWAAYHGYRCLCEGPARGDAHPATFSARVRELCLILILGLASLTVFAQIASLLGPVGKATSMVVLFADLLFLFLGCRRFLPLRRVPEKAPLPGADKTAFLLAQLPILWLGLFLAALTVIPTLTDPLHYDTALYHAQAIRWIEDYGAVPGLGNLHNRFAYNSSFLCLQALFSLKWLCGHSLHTANGFVTWVVLAYCVGGMRLWEQKTLRTSDLLRLLFPLYLFSDANYMLISSPGTDLFALGLFCVLLAQWMTYAEDGEKEETPYGLLSILALFGVSLKLSVAPLVLLALFPAAGLIRRKRYGELWADLGIGFFVILPFLVRNVILSGYLIYPYPELDLFRVDWKMPAYTALFDRYEIQAWGRGLKDVGLYDAGVRQWFPVWSQALGAFRTGLFFASCIAYLLLLLLGIRRMRREKRPESLCLTAAAFLCFGLWILGSPDVRYGGIYLWVAPLMLLGECLAAIPLGGSARQKGEPAEPTSARFTRVGFLRALLALGLLAIFLPLLRFDARALRDGLAGQRGIHDYRQVECWGEPFGSVTVYHPLHGDQSGSDPFPVTPYPARLPLMELRGESLREGFRMKLQYREGYVSTYGDVGEKSLFTKK